LLINSSFIPVLPHRRQALGTTCLLEPLLSILFLVERVLDDPVLLVEALELLHFVSAELI
jgi:hypothetical protein